MKMTTCSMSVIFAQEVVVPVLPVAAFRIAPQPGRNVARLPAPARPPSFRMSRRERAFEGIDTHPLVGCNQSDRVIRGLRAHRNAQGKIEPRKWTGRGADPRPVALRSDKVTSLL